MNESTSRGRSARTPDFSLTNEDLREVAAFAASAAAEVLPIFEAQIPGDDRPRQAVDAALTVAQGAPRSRLQRVTAPAAHRAAKEAPTQAVFHAAMAAGDAAASAYLHPLADVAQVNHILRSAAHAARAKELQCAAEQDAAQQTLEQAAKTGDSSAAVGIVPLPSHVAGNHPCRRACALPGHSPTRATLSGT